MRSLRPDWEHALARVFQVTNSQSAVADGGQQGLDVLVMDRNPALKLIELQGKLSVRSQHSAHAHERTHDKYANLNRPLGVQDAGSHDRTMLGEGIGQARREFQEGKVVAICDHLGLLARRQLEHEIVREPFDVPFGLLVEAFGGDSIGRGEIVAEDDALASDFDDCLVKVLDRYQVAGVFGRGHGQRIPAGRAESRHARGTGDGDGVVGGRTED
jgi:hypothetical protein